MPDFITLSCPSCGHKLQITEDVDRFACAACGNEHIVIRSGGIVTLKPVIESLTKVQEGVDKTASELAIVRLPKEIKVLEEKILKINMSRASHGPNHSPAYFTSVFLVLLFGGIGSLYIALKFIVKSSGAFYNKIELAVIPLIFAIVLFVIAWNLRSKVKNEANEAKRIHNDLNRQRNEEVQQVQDQINLKKKELSEHQNLVSKYK